MKIYKPFLNPRPVNERIINGQYVFVRFAIHGVISFENSNTFANLPYMPQISKNLNKKDIEEYNVLWGITIVTITQANKIVLPLNLNLEKPYPITEHIRVWITATIKERIVVLSNALKYSFSLMIALYVSNVGFFGISLTPTSTKSSLLINELEILEMYG
jgi:hypothetical protein